MKQTLETIKTYFETGDKPKQQEYWDTWESFWHKDEIIPQVTVENLKADLLAKGTAIQLTTDELQLTNANSTVLSAVPLSSLGQSVLLKKEVSFTINDISSSTEFVLLDAPGVDKMNNVHKIVLDAQVIAGYSTTQVSPQFYHEDNNAGFGSPQFDLSYTDNGKTHEIYNNSGVVTLDRWMIENSRFLFKFDVNSDLGQINLKATVFYTVEDLQEIEIYT